jgi:hypothetical protein
MYLVYDHHTPKKFASSSGVGGCDGGRKVAAHIICTHKNLENA